MTNKEKLTKLRSEIAEVYDGNLQMPCKFGDTVSSEVVYLHPDDVIEFLDHLIDNEGDTVAEARATLCAGIAALHLMNAATKGE